MSVKYEIQEGSVFRIDTEADESKAVATFNEATGTLTVPAENKKLKSRIVRELTNLGLQVNKTTVTGDEQAPPEEQPETEPEQETVTVSTVADSEAKTEIPPCPKPRRMLGDKTPEIVEWHHEHDFPEFCRRYGVTEKTKGKDGLYPAKRLTHLTRKIVTSDAASEYID